MKKELEETLVKAYPNLYADYNAPRRNTYTRMSDGFCIRDGWFHIIDDMSKKLEAFIIEQPEEKRGLFKAFQIKEKFGCLRVYLNSGSPITEEIINEAEALSAKTCENCGRPGELRSNRSWIRVECDMCVLLK